MKTAGFDIVLLLNEDFLNQVSGAMFYNNFLTFNGKKDFKPSLTPLQLSKIPDTLEDFLEIRYRFKLLYEPFINFMSGDKVEISAKLRVYIWFLKGLELKFDASLSIETPVSVNSSTKQFQLNLKSSDIKEFTINYNYSATENVKLELDGLFENALHDYFNNPATSFSIDLPSIKAELPFMPPGDAYKVPVDIKAVKTVNDTTLAIAANVFGYNGGDANALTEFARNCNVGLGISERAMNKVYDFFWQHTTWSKRLHPTGSFTIDMVNDVLDFLTELVNFIMSTSVKIASLGFVETELDFISADFEYAVDVDFTTKPTFDIQNGNRVRIFNLGADLFIRVKMYATFDFTVAVDTSGAIPDECTPWNDDIVLERKRKKVLVFDLGVPIHNLVIRSCTGKITINEEKKCLQCVVEELDVNIYDYVGATCDFLLLPSSIKDRIINALKKMVVDAIPPIVLSPTVFELDIKMIDWLVNVEGRKLEINDGEALVAAYVYFKELQNEIWPVPKYIVNLNNGEIHRSGCDAILDTYETHQRGYYLLQNALKKNYDGCKKCLPAFHKR